MGCGVRFRGGSRISRLPGTILYSRACRIVSPSPGSYPACIRGISQWREDFKRSQRSANRALGRTDTARVLEEVCDRLYTVRNQLVHGGAPWNGAVNRQQLKDAASILGRLVPTIIHLMMENASEVWGDPCYPVVE